MPDDHSELVPPLPIPNRTVKRLCADDSAATSVKVGHRQAFIKKPPSLPARGFLLWAMEHHSSPSLPSLIHPPPSPLKPVTDLHSRKVDPVVGLFDPAALSFDFPFSYSVRAITKY